MLLIDPSRLVCSYLFVACPQLLEFIPNLSVRFHFSLISPSFLPQSDGLYADFFPPSFPEACSRVEHTLWIA